MAGQTIKSMFNFFRIKKGIPHGEMANGVTKSDPQFNPGRYHTYEKYFILEGNLDKLEPVEGSLEIMKDTAAPDISSKLDKLRGSKMVKVNVKPYPGVGESDYAHLQPVVDFLMERGSSSVNDYLWGVNRTGYFCHLVGKIDFYNLKNHFNFPDSVNINEDEQSIDCFNTYTVIRGGMGESEN